MLPATFSDVHCLKTWGLMFPPCFLWIFVCLLFFLVLLVSQNRYIRASSLPSSSPLPALTIIRICECTILAILKKKTKFSLTFSSSSYICSSSSSSVKIGIVAIISAIFQPRNYRSFDSFFSCLSQLSQQLLQRHHAIIISISEPLLLYVTWLKFAFKGTIPEQHLCSNFLSQLCITRHLK